MQKETFAETIGLYLNVLKKYIFNFREYCQYYDY